MKTIKLSLLNYRTVLVYTVILSLVKKTLVRLGLRLLQQAVKLLRQKPLTNIPSKFLCLTYSQNGGGPDVGQLHCKLVEGYRKIQGGKRVEKTSGGGSTIPGNWTSFLRVVKNKTELFNCLSEVFYDWFQIGDKELLNCSSLKEVVSWANHRF